MSDNNSNGSFLSPEMMGGIIGAGGYDFQARYITCQLPVWTMNPEFRMFVNEGSGDVDLRFESKQAKQYRKHIQIKNHNVAPSEFKDVVKKFKTLDQQLPNIYSLFVLATLSVSPDVKKVSNALNRIRGIAPFFSDEPQVLDGTHKDLEHLLTQIGLDDCKEFILEKLEFEPQLTDFNIDSLALTYFKGKFVDHSLFKDSIKHLMEHAYAYVFKELSARRGISLDVVKAEELLRRAITNAVKDATPRVVVTVHNWGVQRFEFESDFELDYSSHFNRNTRQVPALEFWKSTIEKDFIELRTKIAQTSANKLIRFQGLASLSVGILFGKNFPLNGGWIIEFKQPQSPDAWNSDAEPFKDQILKSSYEQLNENGEDLLFVFNVTGNARDAVLNANNKLGINAKGIVLVQPSTVGSISISNANEATTIALKARDFLYETRQKQQTLRTHIFFFWSSIDSIVFWPTTYKHW